jgi:hypothetical protein
VYPVYNNGWPQTAYAGPASYQPPLAPMPVPVSASGGTNTAPGRSARLNHAFGTTCAVGVGVGLVGSVVGAHVGAFFIGLPAAAMFGVLYLGSRMLGRSLSNRANQRYWNAMNVQGTMPYPTRGRSRFAF